MSKSANDPIEQPGKIWLQNNADVNAYAVVAINVLMAEYTQHAFEVNGISRQQPKSPDLRQGRMSIIR